jgi:hypothetical protein
MALLHEEYRLCYKNCMLEEVSENILAFYQEILGIIEPITGKYLLATAVYPRAGELPLIGRIAANTGSHYHQVILMMHRLLIR